MVSPASILIADDEPSFLDSTAELLRADGYACDAVPDAHQAVDLLQSKQYDLLIADIKMPGNSNLRLVRETQQIAPGMPVILVTGYPSIDTAVGSIQSPVVAYLTKPLPYRELRPHIRTWLERSRPFRTISEVQDLLDKSLQELDDLKRQCCLPENGGQPTPAGPPTTTIRTLAYCALMLSQMDPPAGSRRDSPPLCVQLECPQWPLYRDAMQKTVEILRKTKNRFKSKDLANLRDDLEALLKKSEKFPHSP